MSGPSAAGQREALDAHRIVLNHISHYVRACFLTERRRGGGLFASRADGATTVFADGKSSLCNMRP